MIYFIGPKFLIEPTEFKYSSVNECLEYFEKHFDIQADLETTGTNFIRDKIVSLQLGDADNQFVIDARHVDVLKFKWLLETKRVLGQNIKFDYKFLKKAGVQISSVYDTMVAETVLYCGFLNWGYGLDRLAERYLQKDLDKTVRVDFTTIGNDPFTYTHIKYMAEDVTYLEAIKSAQELRAIEFDLTRCIKLENKAIIPHAEIEYNGMLLNKEKWLQYEKEAFAKLRELELKLDDELIESDKSYAQLHTYKGKKGRELLVPYQGKDLFDAYQPERKTGINWSSDQQVKKILKSVYDFEAKDKEGKITINSVVLGKIKNKPAIVKTLIDYAEKAKEVSTYGVGFVEQYLQEDGRVRTSFWQVKDTGRVSSGDTNQGLANTQNIPEIHRGFFEASKGRKLVICDYSQQEPRITADYCQDPKLLDFVLNGDGDSHSLVASAVFSKIEGKDVVVNKKNNPYSDRFKMTYREVGKQINLGLDYGKTAYSIKDDLGVSQEEAQEFIDAIKSAFPGKEAFFDIKKQEFWKNGYILHENVTGRKSFYQKFDEIVRFNYYTATKEEKSRYFKTKGGIERNCQNYPIQGTAASMTKLALIYIQDEINKLDYFASLWNVVHDEIVAEVDEDKAEEFGKIMVDCMIRAGKVFCKTVPMKVEPIVSFNWVKD